MLKKTNQKGFTIIEVLIVLAIAGLILLVVFLAVPALQRTSRNTQRKSDVSAISAAIGNFVSNNSGSLPTGFGYVTADKQSATVFCNGAAPTGVTAGSTGTYAAANCPNSNKNYEQAKVGYYDVTTATNVTFNSTATAFSAAAVGSEAATSPSAETMIINLGYSCPSSAGGAGIKNARAYSIYYVTENGSGVGTLQCVGS